jgi:hypothetical protein
MEILKKDKINMKKDHYGNDITHRTYGRDFRSYASTKDKTAPLDDIIEWVGIPKTNKHLFYKCLPVCDAKHHGNNGRLVEMWEIGELDKDNIIKIYNELLQKKETEEKSERTQEIHYTNKPIWGKTKIVGNEPIFKMCKCVYVGRGLWDCTPTEGGETKRKRL